MVTSCAFFCGRCLQFLFFFFGAYSFWDLSGCESCSILWWLLQLCLQLLGCLRIEKSRNLVQMRWKKIGTYVLCKMMYYWRPIICMPSLIIKCDYRSFACHHNYKVWLHGRLRVETGARIMVKETWKTISWAKHMHYGLGPRLW